MTVNSTKPSYNGMQEGYNQGPCYPAPQLFVVGVHHSHLQSQDPLLQSCLHCIDTKEFACQVFFLRNSGTGLLFMMSKLKRCGVKSQVCEW